MVFKRRGHSLINRLQPFLFFTFCHLLAAKLIFQILFIPEVNNLSTCLNRIFKERSMSEENVKSRLQFVRFSVLLLILYGFNLLFFFFFSCLAPCFFPDLVEWWNTFRVMWRGTCFYKSEVFSCGKIKGGRMHILNVSRIKAKVRKYLKSKKKIEIAFFRGGRMNSAECCAGFSSLLNLAAACRHSLWRHARVLHEATANKTETLTCLTSPV